jgi:hypothetical protein
MGFHRAGSARNRSGETIRSIIRYGLTAAIGSIVLSAIVATASSQQMPPDGRALFMANCATCHGATGKGDRTPAEVGFNLPMPNFTDCSFASREADSDWSSIIHNGGPQRAFPRIMPAFGTALNDDEIDAVIGYLRTLCTDTGWPRGEFNYPLAFFTEKAFPEDELLTINSIATQGPASIVSTWVYEKRVGTRSQIELSAPFGYTDSGPGLGRHLGAGDVGIAWKQNLLADLDRGTIFSALGEMVLPTGNEKYGLGSGSLAFEAHALFGQNLPDDFFLQGDVFGSFPTRKDHPDEAAAHFAIGKTYYGPPDGFGRSWSPMLEVLASHEFIDGAKLDWDLVPQLQVSLSTRQHVLASVGYRVPVNDTAGRPQTFMFYLIWDWYDAGLFHVW